MTHALTLADRSTNHVFVRDLLALVGGALQTYYFACAHGALLGPGQPCSTGPAQFPQIEYIIANTRPGGPKIIPPAVDAVLWSQSTKAALWREMNAAYARIAHAIGRDDLRVGWPATGEYGGFLALGADQALGLVNKLIGTVVFRADPQGLTRSTRTFGPSAVTDWLRAGPTAVGGSTGLVVLATAAGAVAGALASAALSKRD